jgi:hypothetical protein
MNNKKTLKEVLAEVDGASKIITDESNGLKGLRKKLREADSALAALVANTDATDEEKANAKKAKDDAQKNYDSEREKIVKQVAEKLVSEREAENLALYSEKVAERRKGRKLASLEADINKTQGEIDVLSLNINAIDKDIQEARLGISTAPKTT